MKRIIFILMLAFVAPMAVEAKAPAVKTYQQSYRAAKKAEKKSLPFAKVHDRKLNRKGHRR